MSNQTLHIVTQSHSNGYWEQTVTIGVYDNKREALRVGLSISPDLEEIGIETVVLNKDTGYRADKSSPLY